MERQTAAKAFAKDVPVDQERKLGDRRRSDTVLVLTVNDADWGLENVSIIMTPSAPFRETKVFGLWGEYGRKAET
jgi:hypothetical protein